MSDSTDTQPDEVPACLIDGDLCVTGPALCEILGVSKQSLGNWSKSGCPKKRRGWYSLREVLAWRGVGGRPGTGEPTAAQRKIEKDVEYREQQAEALRIKNERSSRELVSKAEITETFTPYYAELRRSGMALSRNLVTLIGPFVDAVTARKVGRDADELMKKFLRSIAAGVEYVAPASKNTKDHARGAKHAKKSKA